MRRIKFSDVAACNTHMASHSDSLETPLRALLHSQKMLVCAKFVKCLHFCSEMTHRGSAFEWHRVGSHLVFMEHRTPSPLSSPESSLSVKVQALSQPRRILLLPQKNLVTFKKRRPLVAPTMQHSFGKPMSILCRTLNRYSSVSPPVGSHSECA